MKKQKEQNLIAAKNVEVSYYAACGLLFALGMICLIFMVVLCFRANEPASGDMMMLLSVAAVGLIIIILAVYRRQQRFVSKNLGYSRAAVDRHTDGSSRVEFSIQSQHYYLDVPKGGNLEESGMTDVWYDPDQPRNIWLGAKPSKASPYGQSCAYLLLLLLCVLNFIFYVFLR